MVRYLMKCCLAMSLLLCCPALPAGADIYTWTDENGVKHFSNEPPPGQAVESREEIKHSRVQYEKWQEQRQNRQDSMLQQNRSAAEAENGSKTPKPTLTKRPGKVVMYSTPTCGYCKQAGTFFKQNGITYTEYDITTDRQAEKRFYQLGGRGVPLIVVGDRRIPGFNKPLLTKLFGIQNAAKP